MSERSSAVNLRGVGKRYGSPRKEKWALRGVDLSFSFGEVVGFIGPNGAGKTTLIKLISGLSRTTEGEVEVLGQDLKSGAVTPDGVGLVVEHPTFIPYLSGRKNLKLLAGIRRVADDGDITAALLTVGLDPQARKSRESPKRKQRTARSSARKRIFAPLPLSREAQEPCIRSKISKSSPLASFCYQTLLQDHTPAPPRRNPYLAGEPFALDARSRCPLHARGARPKGRAPTGNLQDFLTRAPARPRRRSRRRLHAPEPGEDSGKRATLRRAYSLPSSRR